MSATVFADLNCDLAANLTEPAGGGDARYVIGRSDASELRENATAFACWASGAGVAESTVSSRMSLEEQNTNVIKSCRVGAETRHTCRRSNHCCQPNGDVTQKQNTSRRMQRTNTWLHPEEPQQILHN